MGLAYLCATGVNNVEQGVALASHYNDLIGETHPTHTGAIGLLVSSYTKPEDGVAPDKDPNTKRFVRFSQIPSILEGVADTSLDVMKAIHYWAKKPDDPDQPYNLVSDVRDMMEYEDIYDRGLIEAIQFNMSNVPPEELLAVKREFPLLEIIMPITKKMFKNTCIGSEINFVYSTAGGFPMDYILIDPSGGKGDNFPVNESISRYISLMQEVGGVRLGIAGGIRPDNLHRVKDFSSQLTDYIGSMPLFSVDFETGIRNENDELDLNMAKRVIYELMTILGIEKD